MSQVTIIGAGVAGLTIAREVLDLSLKVTLIDRYEGIGPHQCSWWAGGMLAPFCEGESAEEPVVRLGAGAAAWGQKHAGSVTQAGALVVSPARDRADMRRFARRPTAFRESGAEAIAKLEPALAGRVSDGRWFAPEAPLAPRAALPTLRAGLHKEGTTCEEGEARPETHTCPRACER